MTKIVNAYIVYELDVWPKTPLRNFTLKKLLVWIDQYSKKRDKEKYVYSGYGIAFDRKVSNLLTKKDKYYSNKYYECCFSKLS